MSLASGVRKWRTLCLESWRPRAFGSAAESGIGSKYAVLVDGDNTNCTKIQMVFDTISALGGDAKIRLLFGDFDSGQFKPWHDIAKQWSFTKMKTPVIIKGKSSVDATLIIEATKLIDEVDGFAIVSSDSDFTPLAIHLREMGKDVIGFGKQQTPLPFVQACSSFKYLDRISFENTGWIPFSNAGTLLQKSDKVDLGFSDKEISKFLMFFNNYFDFSLNTETTSCFVRVKPMVSKLPIDKPISTLPLKKHVRAPASNIRISDEAYAKLKGFIEIGANKDGWMRVQTIEGLLLKEERKSLRIPTGSLFRYFKACPFHFGVSTQNNKRLVRLKSFRKVDDTTDCVSTQETSPTVPDDEQTQQSVPDPGTDCQDPAYSKLKLVIKMGANKDGWMRIDSIGTHVPKPERKLLGIPTGGLVKYFQASPDRFEVLRTQYSAEASVRLVPIVTAAATSSGMSHEPVPVPATNGQIQPSPNSTI